MSRPERRHGRALHRWHELALYRDGDIWTAAVVFRSEVETEDGCHWARRGDAGRIASWLLPACGSCPMPDWHVGFPKGSRSHARSQAQLLDDIQLRYREAAASLLSTHLEFAEAIA